MFVSCLTFLNGLQVLHLDRQSYERIYIKLQAIVLNVINILKLSVEHRWLQRRAEDALRF
jgi:hypothetical protein